MASMSLILTRRIMWAFTVLGLVIVIMGGIGLHYLEGIRIHQLQLEEEWTEYQRMVAAEDVFKEIATDITGWQAGLLTFEQLKAKSDAMARLLYDWGRAEQEASRGTGLVTHEEEEAILLGKAHRYFLELTRVIDVLPSKSNPLAAVALIRSIGQLQATTQLLRQFYFGSIRTSLEKSQRSRSKAHEGSIYFMLIVILLVLGISGYSIRVLHRQARQLVDQQRQLALAALVQHLAHEIRNPLGIVKSAAGIIARRSAGDVAALAQDISSEVERVDELLTDLLNLHRVDNKPKIPVDIAALVQQVAALFAVKLETAGLVLQIKDESLGVFLPCHAAGIRQVLMNLLLNAIEASPEKGSIEIVTKVVGREYVLVVKDHGVGLNPAQKQKIFDLMYTTKPYGFGIGLTVVRRIVEEHGGRIEVADALPHGAVFAVYLPLRI